MKGSADPPSVDRVIALLETDATEEARSCLDTIHTASDRKDTLHHSGHVRRTVRPWWGRSVRL